MTVTTRTGRRPLADRVMAGPDRTDCEHVPRQWRRSVRHGSSKPLKYLSLRWTINHIVLSKWVLLHSSSKSHTSCQKYSWEGQFHGSFTGNSPSSRRATIYAAGSEEADFTYNVNVIEKDCKFNSRCLSRNWQEALSSDHARRGNLR